MAILKTLKKSRNCILKNTKCYFIILSVCVLSFSCKEKKILPLPVSSVEKAEKLIKGKTWQVIDIATIEGSQKSIFENDKSKTDTIIAPSSEKLNWFSAKKGIDTATDFIGKFYKENFIKFKKISMAFNNDSIANTKGVDAEEQIFSINNLVEEKKPIGLRLTFKGDNTTFSNMGVNKAVTTYYILGADEKKMYLLSPYELNDLKLVFLLEAK